MDENNIIISTNTKMSIKIYALNNRIIIKESFADTPVKSYCPKAIFGYSPTYTILYYTILYLKVTRPPLVASTASLSAGTVTVR